VWADEILPLARQAHDRLSFTMHALKQEDRTIAAGNAEEKPVTEGLAYKEWATQVVREELHKAGWRLADLLTQSLKPQSTPAPSPAASGTN
jgi:hypothetical protein